MAAEAPEVLMVDIGLPDMSGLDVIRHATAHHPRCLTMVVSVFGDEGKVLDSIALEVRGAGALVAGPEQIPGQRRR
mgnify:CR=1 FL=1